MQTLRITESFKTPYVNIDPNIGVLEIYGNSIPLNSLDFYSEIFSLIQKYKGKPQKNTLVNIYLNTVNSSSIKCLLQIMKKLENIQIEKKAEIKVNWIYDCEDEDMKELGEYLESNISIKFKYIDVMI